MANPAESCLATPTIQAIAKSHNKSAAQVALRWALQRGTAVIPKTRSEERLIENKGVLEFRLTRDEMASIDKLDLGKRFNDPAVFCEAAFHTFYPIYQ